MASNNDPSAANRLTNNYFFYGTNPVKVPNSAHHSTSTHNIASTAGCNTHHSSLHLTNAHNGFSSTSDLPVTTSLHYFPQSHSNDDENSEVIILFFSKFIMQKKIHLGLFFYLNIGLIKNEKKIIPLSLMCTFENKNTRCRYLSEDRKGKKKDIFAVVLTSFIIK
jgi:hypothetical protein